ncbi:DUF3304 domain-containing protein [Paraburkholderia tagetis]|uniref:DUF3304 domain-containing protein n=1 Tax=Paraburkholderia tagetis TaxID=2913261 RepID=A0A9X1UFB1_9BURK|nr:DUF3304 domain-containing protein [Paraburkholderia tagetis]MCG5074454.1 DUF3304 domain-containing protein [Paraburkholderia tagetis]
MADLQAIRGRQAYHRDVFRKLPVVIPRRLTWFKAAFARSAKSLHTAALAVGTAVALSACGHALPDDPFVSEGQAMAMVPINHTDRYAVNIFVDKYWAGNVTHQAGGGAAACCYPGLKDWRQPVTIRWTWGWEEDPKTNAVTMPDEPHTVVAHFPSGGPHSDRDPMKDDAYVCVILRDLNTAELRFSPSASGCASR